MGNRYATSDWHAKTKFGPKSKKSDENVSSNSSVHQENQCSNHSVDTCGDGRVDDKGKIGIAVKRLIQLTKSIVLVTEMPLQASISASSNKRF